MSVIRNILDRYFLVFGILSVLLLLATVFLGVLWYRDPAGNYEPLTVVMAVLAGLIGTPSLWEAYQRQRELQEQKQDAFRRLDQLNQSTQDWYTQAAPFACSSAAMCSTATVTAGS